MQLVAQHMCKAYGATRALDDVSIHLEAGQVRALIGENGAGKSTLFKVLSGAVPKDSGTMMLNQVPYNPTSMEDAQRVGVAMVFQEISINPSIGIAENIYIDRLRLFSNAIGLINWSALKKAAQNILDSMQAEISINQDLHSLDLGQWKIIEIARALSYNPKVLFFDESTAFLNTQEVNSFLMAIRSLKEKGIAIGFVSHHLDEISKVADKVTILKDGRWVGDYEVGHITTDEIEALMVGREIGRNIYPEKRKMVFDEEILRLEDICIPGRIHNINFTAHKGEIIGIGGLKGSGGEDILDSIIGDSSHVTGSIYYKGKKFSAKKPYDAWDSGIGYLPGDRTSEGLIIDFAVMENLCMAAYPRNGLFLSQFGMKRQSEKSIKDLHIKAQSPQIPCSSLSGGNLQKVVLGKCMAPDPELLLLNNPTRGIDVGARMEIYQIIHRLALEGKSIILLSEDLLELIGLSDRILITRKGEISRIFDKNETPTEEEIIGYMV